MPSYTKTVWEDYPSTKTPVNATNLNNIENGIETLYENQTVINDSYNASTNETYSCNYINNIIESGSNANGNWIKYSDGTMFCWRRITFTSISFNTAWGSVYESASQSFGDTPQTFISTPAIFTSADSAAYAGVEGIHNASTTSYGEAQLFRPVNGSATVALNILAIGKWK